MVSLKLSKQSIILNMRQDPYTTALYYNEIVSDIITTYNEYN
jgi:hypothetical protein